MTKDRAYRLGYDCGYNGPSLTNSSYLIFSTPENTKEWERGKRESEQVKKAETKKMNLFDNNSGAEFSKCGKYRYKLWRIWNDELPKAMCIGLNPSTANAIKPDPTITNLKKMLSKLGYGGFYMMNLFAWISSNPDDLLTCVDPLGENESKLKEAELICQDVIVCWGNFKQAENRIKEVLPNYPNAKCFGKTQSGRPFHPLAMMYAGLTDKPQLLSYSA